MSTPDLSTAESDHLRQAVLAFQGDTGLSAHDLARLVDSHPSTVRHILLGSRMASAELRDRLDAAMRSYREQHAGVHIERDTNGHAIADTPAATRLDPDPDFQATKCARIVTGALDFAARRRLSGGIFGDPGIGKSKAVRQWSATTRYPHLVVTCRAYTSYSKLLRAICRGLGLHRNTMATGEMDEMAHEELTARPRLLVIDEADMLNSRTLDWLRTFQDESSGATNVVYLGKPAFYARLQVSHARSSQDLRQVWSRLAFRRFLVGIDHTEMMAEVGARGLADALLPEAADALYEAIGGSYRDLAMTLALVEQILGENPRLGGKITPAVVAKATESRFGADMLPRARRRA